jgi:hypothetical protein
MKVLALIIMLIALYLLYRIAYPKQGESVRGNDSPSRKSENDLPDVVGKSRFVRPNFGQPQPTRAISVKSEPNEEKAFRFAAENSEKQSAVIPPDELDEVFGEVNPDDLDIPPDDEDDDEDETDLAAEEEAEAMSRIQGLAEGLDFDDLQHVAQVVRQQPETVSRDTGAKIAALEHTDVFEAIVSGDRGKMDWIKSVIDRHVQAGMSERDSENETESKTSDTDYGNFNIADFLNKS